MFLSMIWYNMDRVTYRVKNKEQALDLLNTLLHVKKMVKRFNNPHLYKPLSCGCRWWV